MEKRKADAKELMAVTQGIVAISGASALGCRRGWRSPWAKASNHQTMANNIHEHRKVDVKIRSEWRHFRSTMVVNTSWRKRPCQAPHVSTPRQRERDRAIAAGTCAALTAREEERRAIC